MQGYDKEKALSFVKRSIPQKAYEGFAPQLDGYLKEAQSLNLRFMRETGVLTADGYAGDADYDDDDAFEYIVEGIVKERGLNDEQAVVVASLVDAFMCAHDDFLKKEGLREELT